MENVIDTASEPTAAAQSATKRKKVAGTTKPSKKARAVKKAKTAAKKGAKHAAERPNKKAGVIAMMKRAKGATLAEIMKETGWRAHTVRGFGCRESRR